LNYINPDTRSLNHIYRYPKPESQRTVTLSCNPENICFCSYTCRAKELEAKALGLANVMHYIYFSIVSIPMTLGALFESVELLLAGNLLIFFSPILTIPMAASVHGALEHINKICRGGKSNKLILIIIF